MKLISLVRSDLARFPEKSGIMKWTVVLSSSFRAALLIRFATLRTNSMYPLRVISKFLLKNVFDIEVNSRGTIGSGILLPHPRGIILGSVSIGDNCTIMHGVTLGSDVVDFYLDVDTRPKIGNGCFLGINSVVLGGGRLADSTVVRPNSFIRLNLDEN